MRSAAVVALASFLAFGSCAVPTESTPTRLDGTSVEVVAVWEDAEAARFRLVLDAFEARTGAEVIYSSTAGADVGAVVDERFRSGTPPDVAILPQPGLLARYAQDGRLVPIDPIVGEEVRDGWSEEWIRRGSIGGTLYGLWFKAAHKSLVWYDIATFERFGMVPPASPDGFARIAEALASAGIPAFAISGEDQWTITDWFENLFLRLAGPARYDALADRSLPWTDDSVVETLALLGRLTVPPVAVGGDDGVAQTSFPESVRMVFESHRAAMVMEGDFVAGEIVASTDARIGVDADVFPFPDADPARRLVVGGGDAVVLLRDTPAARALLRHLATPVAAEIWARAGGFISPNENVDLGSYPDATTRAIARSLIQAGPGFRFDLSDLQPAAFGATTGSGMFGILARYAAGGGDPKVVAEALEAAAVSEVGPVRPAVVRSAPDASATPAPRIVRLEGPPRHASSSTAGRRS